MSGVIAGSQPRHPLCPHLGLPAKGKTPRRGQYPLYEPSSSNPSVLPAVPAAAGGRPQEPRSPCPAASGTALSPGRHRAGKAGASSRRHRSRDGAHRGRARASSLIRIATEASGCTRRPHCLVEGVGWPGTSPPRLPSIAGLAEQMRAAGPGREPPLGRIASPTGHRALP